MNLLLLRGLHREARHWGEFPTLLKTISGHQVFTLDLPGYGAHVQFSAPPTISQNTDFLRQKWLDLCQSAPSNAPWGVVAISLGGMVALDWTERYPNDFKLRVLINSSVGGWSPLWHRLRPQALIYLLANALSWTDAQRERVGLRMTSNLPLHGRRRALARNLEILNASAPKRANAVRQLLAAIKYQAPPHKSHDYPGKTLVLRSEHDRMVHPHASRVIADRTQATLISHFTAGHDLPLDDPEWTAQVISDWINTS